MFDGGAGGSGELIRLWGLLVLAAAAPAGAGAQVPAAWKANCQVCHQADGAGLPGQFPRLKGRVGPIAATPEGRAWLAAVVLNGLAGKLVVDGRTIVGVMPGFARLSDGDLAAALNHVAGKGAVKPADIAAARKLPAGNAALMAARAGLVTDGTVR